MVIIKNGKKYYTLEESIKISDKHIMKRADELVIDLKNARKLEINSKEKIYV